MKPRWSIVVRLPEKMPLMSPLMVRIGGNRARIQGAARNRGVKREMRQPANRLATLKEKAIRVWTGIELEKRLQGPTSFSVAPWLSYLHDVPQDRVPADISPLTP